MSMKPSWKNFYPQIKTAVLNLDSLDTLLQQAVEQLMAGYQADCLLWSGLEFGVIDTVRVFTTVKMANGYAASLGFAYPPPPVGGTEADGSNTAVQQFRPRSLPHWLLDQQHSPQLLQLKTGDVILPITNRGSLFELDSSRAVTANSLQFVLQLVRLSQPLQPLSDHQSDGSVHGWTPEELESLEVIGSQLGLAYSALYWRQRLEQSRQQSALVGRISRLLNSTLNPDEIVTRIVAELGMGLQCDRSILLDLRHDLIKVLAVWDHPDRELLPFDSLQIRPGYWQNVVEMFMQGGASYLQIGLNEPKADPLQVWLQDIGALSVLVVPLFIQGEFFGGVALLSYGYERSYLIDELQTIRQVADQAAIALTNAQHYQRLWQQQEALRIQNNSLQRAILRDELTHLMNRRSLERELEQLSMGAIWSISPPFCVIVADIDYFKHVNDAYGHLVGDEVLKEIAKRLQSQLRRGTPAYRYGGEEFVVILTDTPLELALDVTERLRWAVRSTPFKTKGGNLEITASFGVAQQNRAYDHSAWDVLYRADKSLYEAKRSGRDRVFALEATVRS
jgi:diguanylate cyclase (GGDEF)-like protein